MSFHSWIRFHLLGLLNFLNQCFIIFDVAKFVLVFHSFLMLLEMKLLSWFHFLYHLLLVYVTDFCRLILYLATLKNLLMSSIFKMDPSGFSQYSFTSSFPIWIFSLSNCPGYHLLYNVELQLNCLLTVDIIFLGISGGKMFSLHC